MATGTKKSVREFEFDLNLIEPIGGRKWKSTTVTQTPQQLENMEDGGWIVFDAHAHPDGKRLIALVTRPNVNYRVEVNS